MRARWLVAFAACLATHFCGAGFFSGPGLLAAWPVSGVALGAIVLFGRPVVLAVFAAAVIGNLLRAQVVSGATWGGGGALALVVAFGQSIATWVAAEWVLRRCHGQEILRHSVDFFHFAGAVLISYGIGAAIESAAFLGAGRIEPAGFLEFALTSWSGAVVGALVFTPVIFLLARPNFSRLSVRRARFEALCLLATIFISGHLVSSYGSEAPVKGFLGTFLIIPLVLWIGFAFRGLGVAAAVLVLAAVMETSTSHGYLEISGISDQTSLLYIQVFVGVVALVGFGFVSILDERDDHLAEVEGLNAQLESKVAARTRQLERINQELTDTLSVVAHDVRGPVAGIRTLAHHMRWSSLDLSTIEGNELLGEIERTSAMAVAMMARLLDLQRANDRPGTPVATDIGDLVREVCGSHEKAAREKGVALKFVPPRSSGRRMVDAEGLKFIATNLVSNAVKFLPPGGAVEVRVEASDFACRLAVGDDGPGLLPAECAGIFQRFVKSANRPTAGESSTGLGLFIVRKLVLAMDGTLYVESAPGDGARFVVEWSAERETAALG